MGLFGWDLIRSNVTLEGMVSEPPDSASDGDWEFNVHPDPPFRYLLTNPDHYTNQNQLVQCEIRVTDSQRGALVSSSTGLKDAGHQTWVQVVGSWVRDRSHSVYDHDIVADVSSLPDAPSRFLPPDPISFTISTIGGAASGDNDWHKGKTEIHPITSILAIHSAEADNRTRLVEFFAFSDAKNLNLPENQSMFNLPDGDADHICAFSITLPAGTTSFSKQLEADYSISHLKTTFVQHQRYTQLQGVVHVGKASDGHGLYRVGLIVPGWTLLTYLLDRDIIFGYGIRALMKWAKVSSVRALFARVDTAGYSGSRKAADTSSAT